MKTIAKTIIIMLATTALLSLHSGITAKAEEVENTYTYTIKISGRNADDAVKYYETITVQSPKELVGYIADEQATLTTFSVRFYDETTDKLYSAGISASYTTSYLYYQNDILNETASYTDRLYTNRLPVFHVTNDGDNVSTYVTNLKIFGSYEEAILYMRTGDDSGMLNKSDVIPSIDWSVEHDFNGDYYSSDIPTPQLTNLSHNGFNVFNIGDYYIDIICESYYYGAKFENLGFVKGGWVVKPDYEWIYNKHYYNFTCSDIAVNRTTINLSELYGVDNSAALLDDMRKWGSEYPECENLPTYAFGRATSGNSTAYRMAFVYNHMLNTDDLKKLQYSQCAKTVYYVRFYTKDMKYSKWVKYSVSKGTGNADTIGEAFDKWEENNGYIGDYSKVEYEEIQYDDTNQTIVTTPDNKPISTNTVIGSQNNNTGVTDYSTSIDFEDMNMSNFKDAVGGMVDSINDFPTFISRLFGFLPSWVLTMIAIAIGAVVLLRFLGR